MFPLAIAALGAQGPGSPFRLPHPLAPTLPALSEEAEDQLDALVDRFMRFDAGELAGAEGEKANKDFEALKAEAIPALLRGLARSARLDHTCPVTKIAKKLRQLLQDSTDRQLLAFARDEADAVEIRKHRGIVTALRVGITGRLAALEKAGTPIPGSYRDPALASLKVDEIRTMLASRPSDTEWASALLGELATRAEPKTLEVLAAAAANTYPNTRAVGRKHLADWIARQPRGQLSGLLGHAHPEPRRAAALNLLMARDPRGVEAIGLLADPNQAVRQAVHTELVKQAKTDLGAPGETPESQSHAVDAWKKWWKAR